MCRILVVEDDDSLRALITTLLHRQGYVVVEAANGLQALGCLQSDARFDVIVSDIRMPDLDGIRLTELVRRRYAGIPVVIASAYLYQIQEAVKQGAIRHLLKPFSNQQLVETVQAAMRPAG